jgi:lantibiotic modifying enzyme
MCRHAVTRRQLLGMGLGAAAGIVVAPRLLSAFTPPTPPVSDLDVALKAARWIRRSRVETKHGVTWPADPLKPNSVGYDLYNGMSGVILFHLELFHATGDRSWLDDARLGANELTAQLPIMDKAQSAGLYEGLGGAVFVLEETHRATGEGRYRDAARVALAMIHAQAMKTNFGASWQGPSATNDIISGSAGIGLLLLWADQKLGDPASRTLALAAGRHLRDVAIREPSGLKWGVASDVKTLYPNFSHGTAGVSYFLATVMRATGDLSLMAAALSGAKYLESVANKANNGFKVFHHEPGGEDLYYMSWCHGPAGTERLYHRLSQITQRDKWESVVFQAARATIASGAPETQSAGYWNNIGQCCGNAGIGEFFLALQRRSPDASYADMIARVRTNTLERATVDGDGLKWVQAENRVSPQAVVAQTGYMQGAAGVGSFYLHADALAKGRPVSIQWPDSPTFDPCADVQGKGAHDFTDVAGASSPGCGR